MRDLYATYMGDVAAANAISDGGRASGYGSADDYDSSEDDPGAAPCNRASDWWHDLHDAGLALGQMIAMARTDGARKIYGDWLTSNADAEAAALKTWQDDGCTTN